MNKKGAVQLHESILVIFFVMIIIVLGLIVFYRFSLNSLHNYEEEYREQQLLSDLITLPNEFGYTYLGDSRNAIDILKLRYYGDLDYGFKKIELRQVYPEESGEVCDGNSWNHQICTTYVIYEKTSVNFPNVLVESRPVSLYFPFTEEYKAGKLIISSYY